MRRLQTAMVEGIDVLDVMPLLSGEGNAMASVAAASYLVSFRDESVLPVFWQEELVKFYSQPVISVRKETKKGEREINLKEGIYEMEIRPGIPKKGQEQVPEKEIYLLLNASSGGNIKPSFVVDVFLKPYPMNCLLLHSRSTGWIPCRIWVPKRKESWYR